ncbi:hypothetical protein V6N13_052490 [Hibiscus sabdariffa]
MNLSENANNISSSNVLNNTLEYSKSQKCLIFTTSVGMLNLTPAVPLHSVLMVCITGLKKWFLSPTTTCNLADRGSLSFQELCHRCTRKLSQRIRSLDPELGRDAELEN